MRAGILIILLAGLPLPAQPLTNPGGVVNAASYLTSGSPGSAIAQGSIFSIFGTGLGPPAPGVQASRFPLDVVLGGVSVRLQPQSGVPLAAIPLFVSDSQINAILPSSTPVGQVFVSVSYNGRSGGLERIKVVRSSFGIFTRNSSGAGPAIAQNFLSPTELPLNEPGISARPGQTIVLWGTGLGPIAGRDDIALPAANLSEPVEVTIAGRPAPIDYQGRSGCCAGVDQINLRIPADAPVGCAVPLAAKVQNGVYSNITTIAIDPAGGPCSDRLNISGSSRRWGEIELVRTVPESGTVDTATAIFGQGDTRRFAPLGACGAFGNAQVDALDAGPQLTITGPQGSRTLTPRAVGGSYNSTSGPAFLGPGNYTVTSIGGRDVGPFAANLTAGPPLLWSAASGTRSRGIMLEWTGGDAQNGFVVVSGPGLLCTAAVVPGSLTLPAAALANLPAQGMLSVGGVSRALFTAPGLDQGALSYTHWTSRVVNFGEPPLPSSPVMLPNGQRILAELATTNAEQERGLMQRTEIGPDRGMLFLFDRRDFRAFWMYRTLIPLDILWMDQDRRIVFISANTSPCPPEQGQNCPLYGGRELSQYVL